MFSMNCESSVIHMVLKMCKCSW